MCRVCGDYAAYYPTPDFYALRYQKRQRALAVYVGALCYRVCSFFAVRYYLPSQATNTTQRIFI
jgi:hypothetical protein